MEATTNLGTKLWFAIALFTAACGVTPEPESGELGSVCGTAAECAAAARCTADDDCGSDERCHAGTCVVLPGSPVPECGADKTEACPAADLFQAPALDSERVDVARR